MGFRSLLLKRKPIEPANTADSTLTRIKRLLATMIKQPVETIADNADLVKDLGMDSLDVATLIDELEESAQLGPEAWNRFFMALLEIAAHGHGMTLTPAKIAAYADRQKAKA